MSSGTLSESLLRAKVEEVRRKVPLAMAIGIKVDAPWRGCEQLTLGDAAMRVVYCPSVLAFREQLAQAETEKLVLLTNQKEQELGSDVLYRLALSRLHEVRPWQVILERFQARRWDSRLTKEPWMEAPLLRIVAEKQSLTPAPGGFLDEETIWRELLTELLRLSEPRPSAKTLLRWSLSREGLVAWAQLPNDAKMGIGAHLVEHTGPCGPALVSALSAGRGEDLVSIGLVCDLLFSQAATHPELSSVVLKSTGRLESWIGIGTLGAEEGRAWATVSQEVLGELPPDRATQQLRRAEQLLSSFHADALSSLSDALPSSLEQRLTRLGEALGHLARAPKRTHLDAVLAALASSRAHRLWNHEPGRCERLLSACRVAQAVVSVESPLETPRLAELVNHYADTLAWLDRAREDLVEGDRNPVVAAGMTGLYSLAVTVRERHSQQFATALCDFCASGHEQNDVLGVESLLQRVVAPVAARSPVLFLVLDGMSVPVFLSLREDLARLGWIEAMANPVTWPRAAVAMIPTETEASRASLLSGRRMRGQAGTEKNRFAEHSGLRQVSQSGKPPILFHKADLPGESVGLHDEVRRAIEDPEQQVVGVVINAIDDHLSKGDQIAIPQTVDAIRPLGLLLATARAAHRALILTSDHGHIRERGLTLRRSQERPSRSRTATGPVSPDELLMEGPRVLSPQHKIIVPWSERVRYASEKCGYHGGATPQEAVVPVALLLQSEQLPDHFQEAPCRPPSFWNLAAKSKPAPPQDPVRLPPPCVPSVLGSQGVLVGQATSGPPTVSLMPWTSRLLASPILLSRNKQFARLALPKERIVDVLSALDGSGGKLMLAALSQKLGLPLVRVRGILGALRTLLNVDAYPVLTIDESDLSVSLDRPLLERQFELSPEPATTERSPAS